MNRSDEREGEREGEGVEVTGPPVAAPGPSNNR
jgi:hypothetical protein